MHELLQQITTMNLNEMFKHRYLSSISIKPVSLYFSYLCAISVCMIQQFIETYCDDCLAEAICDYLFCLRKIFFDH